MRIRVRGTDEGAAVDIIKPGEGGPETDSVVQSVAVTSGNELLVNVPAVTEPTGFEYGQVVSASGEPQGTPGVPNTPGDSPTDPESPGADAGGNQGGATTEPGASEAGDQGSGSGAGDEGSGSGEQGDGDGTPPAAEGETPPTTSAASEKPLYLIDGDMVPAGYVESGLETPDAKTLYHYVDDVAGGPTTGNADGVSVYAESTDDGQPVVAAAPTEEATA